MVGTIARGRRGGPSPRAQPMGTAVSTGALSLSALIVLLSALVVPAWRKHHHGGAGRRALAGGARVRGRHHGVAHLAGHLAGQDRHGNAGVRPRAMVGLDPRHSCSGNSARPPRRGGRGRGAPRSQIDPNIRHNPPTRSFATVETGRRYRTGGNKVLGLFQNGQEQTVDMIRGEVAAVQLQSVTLLDRAVAQVESRFALGLDAHARMQASTQSDLRTLQEMVADQATSLALALDGVTKVCGAVADQIEASRTRTPQARASHRPAGAAACRAAERARRHARRDLARRRRTRTRRRARADSRPRPTSDPAPTPELVLVPDLSPRPDLDAADAAEPVRSPAARWPGYIRRTDHAPTTVIRLRRRARDATRQVWSRL